MDAARTVSPEAAIGLVIERTGWDHAQAEAWLALQDARGCVPRTSVVQIGKTAPDSRLFGVLPRYRLAQLEQALAAMATPEQPRKGGRPAGLERWYVADHLRQGYSTRAQDLAAARARFGTWTKDWQDLRALRAQHAPAEWREPGPKVISGVE